MRSNYLPKGCDYQGRHPHAAATGAEIRAQMRWLDTYTWIQLDGALDFDRPRLRPLGLPIAPAEVDRMVQLAQPSAPAPAEAATDIGADGWEPVPQPKALLLYLAICGACAVPALIYLVATLWPRH